jgi:hypothetical protein
MTCAQKKHEQEIELAGCEFDGFAITPNMPIRYLYGDVAHHERIDYLRRRMPSKNCTHTSCQLSWIEGLGKIIVRAGFETGDTVNGLAASSQHDYRHRGFCANIPENLAAISAGQHNVQNDHPVVTGQGVVQSVLGIMGECCGESLAVQDAPKHRAKFHVVIDNQDGDGCLLAYGVSGHSQDPAESVVSTELA